MSELTLTQADDGKSVEAAPGDVIVVRVPENPTTGYRWAVEQVDEEILALQDRDFLLAPDAGVGGGGERALAFKVKKAGTAQLRLKLWRDWEGDASITNRYNVTVQVRSS